MKNSVLVAAFVASIFSSFAKADDLPKWQLDGSSNSTLSSTHTENSAGDSSEFTIGTHAYYFLSPHWEVGAYLLFTAVTTSSSGNHNQFRVAPSIVYNFSDTPSSSFFVRGGAGLYIYNSARNASYSAFGYFGSVGKRFAITSSVTWTPEFGVSGHTGADDSGYHWVGTTTYELTLFQFTVLF